LVTSYKRMVHLLSLSICLTLATVSNCKSAAESKPYRDMEIKFKVKCHIPSANSTTFNATLIEQNRGRNAWLNPDREIESKSKANFNDAVYLKGMMLPELDKVLEPYLLISHRCDMRGRTIEGCKTLPVNDKWPDVFPPAYFRDLGIIEVGDLEKC
ncbi:hypothetical protein PFISCL1PPCAC_19369, partial [Pristionchus fissidentatus]